MTSWVLLGPCLRHCLLGVFVDGGIVEPVSVSDAINFRLETAITLVLVGWMDCLELMVHAAYLRTLLSLGRAGQDITETISRCFESIDLTLLARFIA